LRCLEKVAGKGVWLISKRQGGKPHGNGDSDSLDKWRRMIYALSDEDDLATKVSKAIEKLKGILKPYLV
jgi:hypothetical protein